MKIIRSKVLFCFVAGLLGCVMHSPVKAITVISQLPNTTITLGYGGQLEYENPLSGNETIGAYRIIEWCDADYSAGPPRWYDDWIVSHTNEIDGNNEQIWMRNSNHTIWTTTTVSSKAVSIHMCADENDGLAEIIVDGLSVATLDMTTPPGPGNALIVVRGLQNDTHTILIDDKGPGVGTGDDVATLGAAALVFDPTIPTVSQWGLIVMAMLLLALGAVMIQRKLRAAPM